jgi:hypothetical protein
MPPATLPPRFTNFQPYRYILPTPVNGIAYLPVSEGSWGGSVSIVYDYRMYDRGSIPGRGEGFFPVASVQTSSEAHPASCLMSTRSPFPGGKARPGRDADYPPSSSAEVKNE